MVRTRYMTAVVVVRSMDRVAGTRGKSTRKLGAVTPVTVT